MSRAMKMVRVCVVALAALLCWSATAWADDAGYPPVSGPISAERTGVHDVAVIVGVENYPWLPDIEGVRETVRDWEIFFEGLGVRSIYRVVENQATREGIERFVRQATETVDERGTVWFVFVGHGAPDPQEGDGFLVGVDAQPQLESLMARGLRRSELVRTLESGNQRQTVLVLDACFTGEAPDGQALVPGAQPVLPTRVQPTVRGQTVILSASGAGEAAGPLPDLARPAFSYFLLGALRGWAAGEGDSVSAEQAVAYTRSKLRMVPDRRQTPEAIGAADLVLVRGVSEPDPLPNWRGISPRVAEKMRVQAEMREAQRREDALRAEVEAQEQAVADAERRVLSERVEEYQGQRIFESQEVFFQGSWANALEGRAFYDAIGRSDLGDQYKPWNWWGMAASTLGLAALGGGLSYYFAHRSHPENADTTVFARALPTMLYLVPLGGYLGWYGGSLFFSERHPLDLTQRRGAAREHNERMARQLNIPSHMTVTPVVSGESFGVHLRMDY